VHQHRAGLQQSHLAQAVGISKDTEVERLRQQLVRASFARGPSDLGALFRKVAAGSYTTFFNAVLPSTTFHCLLLPTVYYLPYFLPSTTRILVDLPSTTYLLLLLELNPA
jgi:hypothetical protein